MVCDFPVNENLAASDVQSIIRGLELTVHQSCMTLELEFESGLWDLKINCKNVDRLSFIKTPMKDHIRVLNSRTYCKISRLRERS